MSRVGRIAPLLLAAAAVATGVGGVTLAAFGEGLARSSSFGAATDFVPTIRSVPDVTGAPRTPTGAVALGATSGDWNFAPDSYSYQWERCDTAGANCIDIAGATSASYTPAGTDAGSTLRVRVVATNGSVQSASQRSPATDTVKNGLTQTDAPTVATLPVISGTTTVGQTLTVSRGVWNPDVSTTVTYRWQRCSNIGNACADIAGAITNSYTLAPADQNTRIRVRVIGRQGLGTTNYTLTPDTSLID